MAMNTQKVIVGGLAAGVVTNILGFLLFGMFLGPRFNAELDAVVPGASARMNTPGAMTATILTQFVIGLLLVWIYAAIRPRFGPGFRTAAYAALVIWICGFVFYQGWYFGGLMTGMSYILAAVVNGAILLVGAYVGGMLYKEEGAGAAAMAAART
jgi:uncharacterized membrane protein